MDVKVASASSKRSSLASIRHLLAAYIITGAIAGGAAALALLVVGSPVRILPGVTVQGLPIGGVSAAEAKRRLDLAWESTVQQPVTLEMDGETWLLDPSTLGIHLASDKLIAQALAIGRQGDLLERLTDVWHARKGRYDIRPIVHADHAAVDQWLDELSTKVKRAPTNASVEVNSAGHVILHPSLDGRELQREDARTSLLRTALNRSNRHLMVPIHLTPATVQVEDLQKLKIERPVATFTTRFSSGDPNRVHNILLASETLHGVVLAPGESFSFNARVGPRMEELGYKEAPVIIRGELVPDIGGGVCQVSTTLYNAALLAGLRIDARSPHSIPPTYVPLGMDAAVSYGHLDLRFTNTTNQALYIASFVNGDQLSVSLYGHKPSPRIWIEPVVDAVIPPRVREVFDPTLPVGTIVTDREGWNGYNVTLWKVHGEDGGDPDRTLMGRSHYPPRERVVRIGSE